MDAQNAAESIATKPPASSNVSPSRTGGPSGPSQSNKPSSPTPALIKSPSASVPAPSPPGKEKDKDAKNPPTASQQPAQEDDAGADNNSEAETIVLAGKDGSPIKSRKVIKREDNSDDDRRGRPVEMPPKRKSSDPKTTANGLREGSNGPRSHPPDAAKRKRLMDQPQSKDSSGLSSAPGSPLTLSRGRSADGRPEPDSESVHAKPIRPTIKERDRESRDKDVIKSKSLDRPLPHKRKAPRGESDDEAEPEIHKARRQRTSASIDASSTSHRPQQKDRDHPKPSSKLTHETPSRHRSTSPHPRTHRRSASTQVQSSTGLSQKKKRVPPPLSTDYHSDESSASGSPHIRSATARGLATPATADSNMASAKNPAHKKHVDAHGQTQLAKACSRGEYDIVKRRLHERPEDLNFPDYAGNTPLQIASINGFERIVKLLVESGCDIDCVNHDKDTPLLDAVDNGHLGVVKVLLDAGVNPRKGNVHGEEPLDRIDDDMDNAQEIRDVLIEARKKLGERRKTSEERLDNQETRSSHGADSPRRSPAVPEPAFGSRRAASSRSHKLSNSVLYMHVDDQSLRKAAGTGNVEMVERILQVRDNLDDPESMVAAARGGHDTVMNLLLALGGADPDPPPVRGVADEFATPILAAIGQENTRIIPLLLAQPNFDPTKKFKGETYYEIARKRMGSNWKEEEHMLKKAYDEYRKSHRDPSKKSPNRKEQESKRSGRADSRDESSKPLKRKATSPGREGQRVAHKPRDKDAKGPDSHMSRSDEPMSPNKRGPGRPKKDDRGLPTIAISDGETSPPATKTSKAKRPDPDHAAMSSEGEANKPRRKLLSGRDIKEQQKNRRASMVSNSSSLREPSSPRDTRHDDAHQPPTEKYHDRAKVIKRDESRDRLSVSGDHSGKRSRTSATPDHVTSEKEGEQPVKKRKIDGGDKKERVPKSSSSPDRNRKSGASRETLGSSKHDDKPTRKPHDHIDKRDTAKSRKPDATSDQNRRESGKSAPSDKSIHVKSEDSDVVMRDAEPVQDEASKLRAKEDEKKRRMEMEAKRKEKEQEKELEERKRREEQERREAEAKKREEEKEKLRLEEEERKKREEEARKKREEEEAHQRRLKEEEEQRKAEEARVRLEKEEQERKKREEEERVRREQEAAEEARRKREEEERREQERRAREEQRQRRIREEQERKRLEKLPAFLRWLDRSSNAKTTEMARRWRILRGVRFDSIRPETAGTPEGREQWVLNTQVAMLLGESDIQLSRFSGWERVRASEPAKYLVMGLAKPKPALTVRDEWDLGKQLPGYYLGKEPDQLTYQEKRQLEEESKAKFLALDLFFVKLSDLMFAIPNIPHLRNLEIVVSYHEIAETLEQHDDGDYPSRWKEDSDAARYMGFCPRNKYFVNGQLVREGTVDVTSASYTPWPECRVPRYGLTAVPPSDPNYARLAKEQGLEHLLSGLRTPPLTIGAQTSPNRLFPQRAFDDLSPPQSESTATANGDGHHPRSSTGSTAEQDRPMVNGNTEPTPLENGADGNN